MLEYTDKIREIAARLLKECTVDMVIGFRRGTVPMMNEPCFVKDVAGVENLVWDGNCGINLANYLMGRKEKIGIVAKGCDARNIATHIVENKINRDQLFIIGVPCTGMLDRRKITALVEGEIREVVEDGHNVSVRGEGFEQVLNRREVLQ